jgi:hypothetical protein
MMREANAQEALHNACEVKVSLNWEGVCDHYSALTRKAFMDDYYEKVDVNDLCPKPRSCQSLT